MSKTSASILGSPITSASIEQYLKFERDNYRYYAHAVLTKHADSDTYEVSANLSRYSNPHRPPQTIKLLDDDYRTPIAPEDNIGKLATYLLELLEKLTIAAIKQIENGDING